MDKPVKWKVTLDQIMAAIEADDNLGFCLACGEECVWQVHLAHFGGLIWPTLSC
jgi:hypothetical protein